LRPQLFVLPLEVYFTDMYNLGYDLILSAVFNVTIMLMGCMLLFLILMAGSYFYTFLPLIAAPGLTHVLLFLP